MNEVFGSRNKKKSESPVKKYIEWSGSEGKFKYYDGENIVFLDTPLYIQPLDSLSTVKGWDDASQSGIYSNEVRNAGDTFYVKSFKGGDLGSGKWKDLDVNGARFTKSIYAALIHGKDDVELVNFQLYGGALGAYFDSEIDKNIWAGVSGIIEITKNPNQQKKGATKYWIPEFKTHKRRDDIISSCVDLNNQLQDYLDEKLNSKDDTQRDHSKQEKVEATKEFFSKQDSPAQGGGVDDDLPF